MRGATWLALWGALGGALALPACSGSGAGGALAVLTVSPPLGSVRGGDVLTLGGRAFLPGAQVLFGGAVIKPAEVLSPESLRVTVPAWPGDPGAIALTVVNPDGERAIRHDAFHYYALELGLSRTPRLPAEPRAVATADLNKDGAADVVVATSSPAGLSVLWGRGDGSLGPAQRLPGGSDPVSLLLVDVSGDGQADLVVGDAGSRVLRVWAGRSAGRFIAAGEAPVGCPPASLAALDLDGDGLLDVAVGCGDGSGEVRTLHNTSATGPGAGMVRFAAAQRTPAGSGEVALAAADLDGDGRRDLLAAARTAGTVTPLLARAGALQAGDPLVACSEPVAIAAADLDRDGLLEAVVACRGDRSVRLLSVGSGGRLVARGRSELTAAPSDVALLDLDGDGRLDVAATTEDDDAVFTLRTLGGGGSSGGLDAPVRAPGSRAVLARAADLDGDRRPALLTAARGTSEIRVQAPQPGGTLGDPRSFSVAAAPEGLLTADVSGDAIVDLVWVSRAEATVTVLIGTGDGGFFAPQVFPTAAGPVAVAAADLNGDRTPDLAVACRDADAVSVFLAQGGGRFQPAYDVPVEPEPVALALGDVSGDGTVDLVTAGHARSALSVYIGRGNGAFTPSASVPLGARPLSLALYDVDDDGHRDAVVLGEDGVRTVRGLGGALGFAPPLLSAVPGAASALTFLDANLDGYRDVAVASARGDRVHLLLGDAAGVFTPIQAVPLLPGTAPQHLTAADLDRDGNLDVVAAGQGSTVAVLLGRADGTLLPPLRFDSGYPPSGLAQLDADRDRWSDLVVVSGAGYALLPNRPTR